MIIWLYYRLLEWIIENEDWISEQLNKYEEYKFRLKKTNIIQYILLICLEIALLFCLAMVIVCLIQIALMALGLFLQLIALAIAEWISWVFPPKP